MINFKLRELENIIPWGQETELSLHWFALTDGDLWLKFGNEIIYEYSLEVMNYWGDKPTPYNDYQLSRFIEDFTGIFDKIRETIPKELYDLTEDLKKIQTDAKKWLEILDTDKEENNDVYFDEYEKLISWTCERSFNSIHLIGGPNLSFFRRNDIVRLVWETEHTLENGINLWTAKDGSFEMDYSDFVTKIKIFGQSFFAEMDKQVELTVSKEWGPIKIDKQRLVEEHKERKEEFYSKLLLLDKAPTNKTNWKEIEQIFNRMESEFK